MNRDGPLNDYQGEPRIGRPDVNEPEASDAVLAVRCQLGDADAWEALVRRWHPRLSRFIARMLSDGAAVDDVLQTVWLRVVRSLVQLKEPERLAAWLYGVARRTVADRFREQYRRPPADEIVEIPDWDGGPDMLAVVDEVEASLGRLHPADREAVVLHYLEELPVAEVAEVCGVPPGTIKSRLHRARRILQSTLT
jgi:RNA polymerase sigma factor (sigma-70 family)